MKKLHQVEVTLQREWKVIVYVEDPDQAEEVAVREADDENVTAIDSIVKDEVSAKELEG